MSTRFSDDPDLDALLAASRPPTPLADGMTAADVAALVEDARSRALGRCGRLRRTARRHVVAVSVTAALGLVGVGAAAAAVQATWSRWAQDPDVVFTYTLPSGAACEQRIGATIGVAPEVVDAARAYFRENDVLALADVEGEIARMRADTITWIDPDGTRHDASYGTDRYKTPDQEYADAVSRAVSEVFSAELARQGVDVSGSGSYGGFAGEASCPGADW